MSKRSKMDKALAWLDRKQGNSLERAELARHENYPDCEVRLDRLELTASGLSEDLIMGKAGLRRTKKHLLRPRSPDDFVGYRRVTWFSGANSIHKMRVLSERRAQRLAEFKLTMFARDKTGLAPNDVLAVVRLLQEARVVRVLEVGSLCSEA